MVSFEAGVRRVMVGSSVETTGRRVGEVWYRVGVPVLDSALRDWI